MQNLKPSLYNPGLIAIDTQENPCSFEKLHRDTDLQLLPDDEMTEISRASGVHLCFSV